MGTKLVVLALVLLLPGTVSAEAEDGNEDVSAQVCSPVEVVVSPPDADVHPECVGISYAEESK